MEGRRCPKALTMSRDQRVMAHRPIDSDGRDRRIRRGSFLMPMPFQDPVRIAEGGACVDNWSNGRLNLVVGPAYRIDKFAGLCRPRRERSAEVSTWSIACGHRSG